MSGFLNGIYKKSESEPTPFLKSYFLSGLVQFCLIIIYIFFFIPRPVPAPQGAVATRATLSMEQFPPEQRGLAFLGDAGFWAAGAVLLAPAVLALQHAAWRTTQLALSAASLAALGLQLWWAFVTLKTPKEVAKAQRTYSVIKGLFI